MMNLFKPDLGGARRHPSPAVRLALAALIAAAPHALAAPTMQLVYPVAGAEVEGTVNLRVFAYEGLIVTQTSDIDTVKFFRKSVPGTVIQLTRIANTGEWSGVWNASALTPGVDTLVFRAINNPTATDSQFAVTIVSAGTTVAPTVTITSPTPGAAIAGSQAIEFTAAAGSGTISTREISVDGGAYAATSAAASHSLNTVPLAEGSHTVRLRITNSNGAATESRITTYFVENLPTLDFSAPAGGSSVGGNLVLSYDATPKGSATIASDSLLVDGQAFAALNIPDGPDTVDISSLADGSHSFQIKATDSNGKIGWSRTVSLLVANGPFATLLTPQGGQTLSGRAALAYRDSAVAPATVVSDTLLLDGKAHQALSLTGADTLDTSPLPDGEHTLQVRTRDSRGRTGLSQSILVLVRNGPTALIDSALADSTVSGRLVIRFRVAAVAPATVAARQLSIDGGAFRAAGGDSTDTLDTRPLSEGAHTAQVRVVDSQGKEGLSRLVKFNVRNAPTVAITAPAVDEYVRGIVTVRFTAAAVAPDTVKATEISIGGGAWIPTTSGTSHSLDTRAFKDGDLRIQVRAVDGSGKMALTPAREMVVDNSAPRVSYPSATYPDGAPAARRGVAVTVSAQALDLGSGMDSDSALVLQVRFGDSARSVMHDDGLAGDKVAGDNVYSTVLDLQSGQTGSLAYSLRGRDRLGNEVELLAAIAIDNIAPSVAFSVEPAPGNQAGSLSGEVHVQRVLLSGTYSDSGGSGMRTLQVTVRNPDSDHVNSSPEGIPLVDGSFRRVVELVPGVNRIELIGSDKAGNKDTARATVTYVPPKETRIVSGDGGRVFGADGSGVDIPAGALASAREITVRRADPGEEPKPRDTSIRLVGVPHEFGPDGLTFPAPVTLTLRYTDADLDRDQDGSADFDEGRLTIVFWNGRAWVKAGDAAVDRERNTVSVAVNHFTLFDIAEDSGPAASTVSAWWDRNPVPGNAEFLYRVPSAGTISLHILDMAGDVVKTLIMPGTTVSNSGSVRWDGSNVRGHFAGAGLYVYVFKYASDDGTVGKTIRKPVGLVRK